MAPLSDRRLVASQRAGVSEAGRPAASDAIEIVEARIHNLRDVSLTLPRSGPPRPIQLGVLRGGRLRPLSLR